MNSPNNLAGRAVPAPAAHARAAFEQVHGCAPEGLWAAPGRVNLIGEHTDYNDGFVVPLALPHATVAAVTPTGGDVLRLASRDASAGLSDVVEVDLDRLAPGTVDGWAAYPAGVVWALRDAGYAIGGATVAFASDVPVGAGLSSSAALEVVTALALNDIYSLGLPRERIARLSQRAENHFVGMPCGILDQMASACCTPGHILHLDTRDLRQRQIPFDMAAEGLRLLVVDTQVTHALADGAYAERRAACEAGAAALGVAALRDVSFADLDAVLARLDDATARRRVRHVVTENERVRRVIELLDAGRPEDVRCVGPVLTEGHASLRDDFEVSCPELDLVVTAALAAGALGARMTGGGFGGSAIVLVEADTADATAKEVADAFAAAGHRPPRVFEATPSAGARRL